MPIQVLLIPAFTIFCGLAIAAMLARHFGGISGFLIWIISTIYLVSNSRRTFRNAEDYIMGCIVVGVIVSVIYFIILIVLKKFKQIDKIVKKDQSTTENKIIIYCPNCGTARKDNAEFCSDCGGKL